MKQWLDIRRDQDHGIDSISAHFEGHAYDPHDHDEMLVGVTLQGVQRFRCGRSLHVSTPGKAILIEPGAIHDGNAPEADGFTYAMLYLPQEWLTPTLAQLGLPEFSRLAAFRHTLSDDRSLSTTIHRAFLALHEGHGRLARDQYLDALLVHLCGHLDPAGATAISASPQIQRVRELLHAGMSEDIGLAELASQSGMDRFRLSRQFKAAYGCAPHAYLVQLRLRAARRLLARGNTPAEVASEVGFADQSHLGRWFQRVYRISPAAYRKACTNVLA